MPPRLLLSLLLFAFGTGSLRAQESLESQTFKQRLRGQYLHNDTAQAIINLYGVRQAGGAGWILSAGLAAVRIATSPNQTTTTYGGTTTVTDRGDNTALAFLFAAPFAAYGTGKLVHYSNGKLDRILADYAAGKPLAPALRRKLKPRFFKQPIIKYQPVKVVPAK